MADFRNRLLIIAGVSTLFAGLAGAQVGATLNCVPGAGAGGGAVPAGSTAVVAGEYGPIGDPGNGTKPTQPIELRSEGATELVSDTVFNCDATATNLQGQVTAFLNGNVPGLSITSTLPILQIIDNSGADAPHPTLIYQGTVPNLAAGASTQQVIFGTSSVGTGIYTAGAVTFPNYNFIIEISNIRVNVTGLLNPNAPTPVTETVFAGAEGVATLFQSNAITVGFVLKSLNVALAPLTTVNYVVCQSNTQIAGASFDVTVSELFAGAFKTPDAPAPTLTIPAPSNIPGGEQGSYPGVGGIEQTPLGTRIKFVVANIPAGVTGLAVPNVICATGGSNEDTCKTLELDLVSGGETGTSGVVTDAAGGSTTLGIASGSVTVIYQVNTEDLSQIKKFDFTPTLIFLANAVVGAQAAVTVTTSYSPSPVAPGGAVIPIPTNYLPWFANTGVPLNVSAFSVCETDLLFPFVTSVGNYETGIAIANTASDPFGTTGQPGACSLYFYGSGQVPAATSPVTATTTMMAASIPIGGVSTTVVSPFIGTAFTGYVIARCQFLFAHGFAFVTNGPAAGSSAVAQGYVALVLPNGPKARVATNGSAENLNE